MNNIFKSAEIVFPIFGGKVNLKEKLFIPNRLIGTAFYIGNKSYLTAGHVLTQVKEYEYSVIGFMPKNSPTPSMPKYADIIDFEVSEKHDLGILRVQQYLGSGSLTISSQTYYATDDIQTYGYPFGLDVSTQSIFQRSFKGHIISSRSFKNQNIDTNCFELSIHCPRGLSGAPIIYHSPSEFSIIGYVIGNTSQEIEIYENKEIVEDGKQIYYERRMETTKFGLAVQMISVLDFESRILKTTLQDHLKNVKLLT
jgi:hypothetical protein